MIQLEGNGARNRRPLSSFLNSPKFITKMLVGLFSRARRRTSKCPPPPTGRNRWEEKKSSSEELREREKGENNLKHLSFSLLDPSFSSFLQPTSIAPSRGPGCFLSYKGAGLFFHLLCSHSKIEAPRVSC